MERFEIMLFNSDDPIKGVEASKMGKQRNSSPVIMHL